MWSVLCVCSLAGEVASQALRRAGADYDKFCVRKLYSRLNSPVVTTTYSALDGVQQSRLDGEEFCSPVMHE